MKKHRLTWEQHERVAAHVVGILEHLHELWKVFDERRETRSWNRRLLRIGQLTNSLQMEMESDLTRLDGNDLRSWDLYYPDTPAARTAWHG